jgi:glycosyltransferase involved in cell wall biosynthesis
VVPVYNEQHSLPQSIPTLRDFLHSDSFPYEWKIIIADNASIDDTPGVSHGLAERFPGEVDYVRIERKGRGYALKQTWGNSSADILSYMDVDLSTSLTAFPKLIGSIAEDGYGVATGSRLTRNSRTTRSFKRTVLSVGYNTIIKVGFWTRFSDAQCGFKAISSEVARRSCRSSRTTTGSSYRLLILAEKMGYQVKDIRWNGSRTGHARQDQGTVSEDLRGLWRMRTDRPCAGPSLTDLLQRLHLRWASIFLITSTYVNDGPSRVPRAYNH